MVMGRRSSTRGAVEKDEKVVPPPGRTAVSVGIFSAVQILLIILYATCTEYSPSTIGPASDAESAQATAEVQQYYPFFQHIHVMIFIGFGFLMTFLRRYRFGAVGFTLMVGAVSLLWGILCHGFWHCAINGTWHKIELDITKLIIGDFAGGAVMITYGAVLGKVSPLQLLVLSMMEIIIYAFNEAIGVIEYEAVDMGGSMFVHMFGGFFGVAASYILSNKGDIEKSERFNGSDRTSDTFAMIGTVFLWMYWPSFNGAFAEGTSRQRVIVNTVLALCASTSSSFLASHVLRKDGRFSMVDVQNATLAGGVAVGTSSDLVVGAWPALVLGTLAGVLSVVGYTRLLPALEARCGIHDTCGVLNLHALPGALGAIGGILATLADHKRVYGADVGSVWPARAGEDGRSAAEQAGYQAAAMATTLALSIGGGVVCGMLVRSMGPVLQSPRAYSYQDDRYWEVEDPDSEGVAGSQILVQPEAKYDTSPDTASLDELAQMLPQLRGLLAAQKAACLNGGPTPATIAAADLDPSRNA